MNDINEENLKLVYVNPIGKNSADCFEYEFFFSETPDIVWGQDWNVQSPSSCGDTRPDSTTYHLIKRLRTFIPFTCAQQNSCFSLQDMCDHIIACCWEDISEYDDFPEPYRIVFEFGEDYTSVEAKLASRSQLFSDIISYGDDGVKGNGDEYEDEEENENGE